MAIMSARPPLPYNEPIRSYVPGSAERASLQARLAELAADQVDMPLVIGGREVRNGRTVPAVMPHRTGHTLGTVHWAGQAELEQAIAAAGAAWPEWSRLPWTERAAVFLRAADLLTGPWRDTLNAATMLGQSKTAHQAEIDSACELIDFWRYNAYFGDRLLRQQPFNDATAWNRIEYRPLEGFVFAVSPFNFTSIAGNLPTAPMLMGNTVVFKPATQTLLVC
ncbi:MAG TPA: aldehyde dehydrogenase family protein, partial [Candidatus Dormibacteraeota bacterium]|nr:aldehyde dehydrogenase family protein [Candidatus Dormibacteraeota bacterium]